MNMVLYVVYLTIKDIAGVNRFVNNQQQLYSAQKLLAPFPKQGAKSDGDDSVSPEDKM